MNNNLLKKNQGINLFQWQGITLKPMLKMIIIVDRLRTNLLKHLQLDAVLVNVDLLEGLVLQAEMV